MIGLASQSVDVEFESEQALWGHLDVALSVRVSMPHTLLAVI
jgi:hypothetical protein